MFLNFPEDYFSVKSTTMTKLVSGTLSGEKSGLMGNEVRWFCSSREAVVSEKYQDIFIMVTGDDIGDDKAVILVISQHQPLS